VNEQNCVSNFRYEADVQYENRPEAWKGQIHCHKVTEILIFAADD